MLYIFLLVGIVYTVSSRLQPGLSFGRERASSGSWPEHQLSLAQPREHTGHFTDRARDDLLWGGGWDRRLVLTINVSFIIFQFPLRTGRVV